MNNIILIGAGGHANSCIDVIETEGKYNILGLIDNNISKNKRIYNYKIIGTDKDLKIIKKKCENAIICIGQIKNYETRLKIYKLLKKNKYTLPIIQSPKSYKSKHSKIGDGTILMHGSIVNIGSIIGENCIINTSSLVEHDVIIGSHCHISTKAVVNGGARIGDCTFIGSGSVIHHNVKIGKNCIIGSNSIVDKDLPNNKLFIGK
tara:strand:- start:198 stop:812 length:615 start_codon:yes stop_codon:yes gene_type:complete